MFGVGLPFAVDSEASSIFLKNTGIPHKNARQGVFSVLQSNLERSKGATTGYLCSLFTVGSGS